MKLSLLLLNFIHSLFTSLIPSPVSVSYINLSLIPVLIPNQSQLPSLSFLRCLIPILISSLSLTRHSTTHSQYQPHLSGAITIDNYAKCAK